MSGKKNTRDRYRDVGRALRESSSIAIQADLPPAAYRVLVAVTAAVASYSRLEDHITLERVAELAGVHPKTAASMLRLLRDLGAVVYVPAVGRPLKDQSSAARIGFPPVEEREPLGALISGDEREPSPAPVSPEKGSRLDTKREPFGHEKGAAVVPYKTEKVSEKISRAVARAHAHAREEQRRSEISEEHDTVPAADAAADEPREERSDEQRDETAVAAKVFATASPRLEEQSDRDFDAWAEATLASGPLGAGIVGAARRARAASRNHEAAA
ncbi:MAG TPA: hypothetical protein VGH82_17230 [Gaiellaceae bacterium]